MIKCFSILLFLFLSTFDIYGQYEPMTVEGAHWVVFDKYNDSTYHHMLKIEGDTTVNNVTYKKLYRREIQSTATQIQDFLPPYYYDGVPELVGLIRDDLPSEMVYGIFFTTQFSECSIGEEELVHDFSLPAGAYLPGCLHEVQGTPYAGIDSVKNEFIWGKQREVQYVSTGYRFIEGVGGNSGPFSSGAITVPGILTVVVDYCIGTDTECSLLPVGTDETNVTGLKIYPNPAVGSIKIEFGNEFKGSTRIRLYGISGRIVNKLTIDCSLTSIISFSPDRVDRGIYFLNIQSGNHSTICRIIIR